jgi:hypothetical protein
LVSGLVVSKFRHGYVCASSDFTITVGVVYNHHPPPVTPSAVCKSVAFGCLITHVVIGGGACALDTGVTIVK